MPPLLGVDQRFITPRSLAFHHANTVDNDGGFAKVADITIFIFN
ncbi:hypothetical protein [Psychrobacter celer]|jgi:hypothetical protein